MVSEATSNLLQDSGKEEHDDEEEEQQQLIWKKLWVETKKMWVVAGPAILTRVSMFGVFIIAQAFIGHIGNIQLAAFSVVFHVLARFSLGILMGMPSGLETLCGQAFGAKQYHMLGIYLQRSWLMESGFFLLLIPIFIFSAPILKLLGQTEEITVMANIISLWYIPIIFSYVFLYTLQMYLQIQSKNMIITWLAAVTLFLHGFCSWILVDKMGLGIAGVMISMNLASWVPIVGQLIFIFYGGCPLTWTGFSMLAFSDLWPVIKLSVSSGVMLCLEIWYNTLLILFTESSKNAEVTLDALSICVRVSNELGRGSAKAAKFAIKVVVATSLIIGVVPWALVLAFRHKVSYIFSISVKVANAFADLSILLAVTLLLNSIQPVLSGVAVGAGWQSIVAYVNIICYYCVGLPLGLLLYYVFNQSVKGMWMGMIGGTFVQTLVLIYYVYNTDWDKQENY